MRILVTYAVQGEFTELKFPGLIGEEEVQVGYLRTGIGKVKSAFYLTEAINRAQPDLVVNMGTAGTVRQERLLPALAGRRNMQYGRYFPDGTVGCDRGCRGYGGLCPGIGVPCQKYAVHRREVCDRYYRAEFGETLGR